MVVDGDIVDFVDKQINMRAHIIWKDDKIIMAIIPVPKTHPDVAKNQHLIPRCYLKAWKHNSGKDPKVWVYDKSINYCESNSANSNWILKSYLTKDIMAKNGFHDIKAGFPYMPDDALHEIFDDILQFNITIDGLVLNSADLLSQNLTEFDRWIIKDSSGVEITPDERLELKKYFNESRWIFVETEWAKQYENNWEHFIQTIENKVQQIYKLKSNSDKKFSLTLNDLKLLVKYCLIYNWRSFVGNELFNEVFNKLFADIPLLDDLKNMVISESDRIYEDDLTMYDEVKHASIIKTFVDYLESDSGKMKVVEDAFIKKLAPVFLLTDTNNPFITSDVPSFTRERKDGLKELLFVATPTMLIGYGRGNSDSFVVSKLSSSEVLDYNKSIAQYGSKLVIKDGTFNVKQLFI